MIWEKHLFHMGTGDTGCRADLLECYLNSYITILFLIETKNMKDLRLNDTKVFNILYIHFFKFQDILEK